ncbi:MAG: hypothetical protein C5B47_05215 [Verrucomicrobia bacterium]|nr:MAG: hypothetical protein C5B47_05215 [Verrucomicrobiota bacterium]
MMSPIHINRDRQTLGQFTPEEVSAGLAEGRFRPSDLGWCPGMETWKYLSDFQDLPAVPLEVPPPVTQVAAPSTVPLEPPWERRFKLGYSQALLQTIGKLLTKPHGVFSAMRTKGDFVSPLLYIIFLTVAVGIVTLPYGSLYGNAMKRLIELLPNVQDYPMGMFQPQPLNLANVGMAIVLMPVLATVGSFLRAGLLHLVLYLVGGANKGFESTYRITCYSDATTAIFRVIPFLGVLVAIVLDFWLLIVGLKKVNRIEGWRAALTVFFLPICFLVFLLACAIFMGFASTF